MNWVFLNQDNNIFPQFECNCCGNLGYDGFHFRVGKIRGFDCFKCIQQNKTSVFANLEGKTYPQRFIKKYKKILKKNKKN